MRLIGKVFDFGNRAPSAHLKAIAAELKEPACINGEDNVAQRQHSRFTILSAFYTGLESRSRIGAAEIANSAA